MIGGGNAKMYAYTANNNYYNPYVRNDLELYHHGIAGQKWGKRNGPPYPLAAGAHSAAEKKAGWKGSIYKDGKSTHFSRKVEKYIAKKGDGKNTRRARKALNLLERQKAKDTYELRKAEAKGKTEKADQYKKRIASGEKKAKELIKNYANKGYTISSAKVIRDAAYGKHFFTNNMTEVRGIHVFTVGHTLLRRGRNYVEGNRYKVSKKENPRYLKRERQGRNWEASNRMKNVAKVADTLVFHAPGGYRVSNYRRVATGRRK